ncbi:class II lanthipeptide, LchA2/BrtA2 family [Fructilactobacillus sanfranciscensis]|nr:class II lanthipeptide, LchA2/BrtA2 family [Fructilactobacillus sanfranciscensis]MVF15997.1 hypothetical protein [Fructilactobacillus sanfranciscensis]TNK95151.1 hypothetical protein DKP74_06195 [Fructilactobacillus sanfranciscensis]TNK97081.1 hypothetical protein DKP75_05610 [Fructilactobacillus sanfranciscensis]
MNKKEDNKVNLDLELGKYLEKDMLEISDGDEIVGGTTPVIGYSAVIVSGFVSSHTCPTTACTRAC